MNDFPVHENLLVDNEIHNTGFSGALERPRLISNLERLRRRGLGEKGLGRKGLERARRHFTGEKTGRGEMAYEMRQDKSEGMGSEIALLALCLNSTDLSTLEELIIFLW
jgi:hypothetical protein